jgi:DNA-directed RNA polymerase sigma subunit (sigma70/sigma32)
VTEPLEQVRKSADRIARLKPQLEMEQRRLHAAIVASHKQGYSMALIARAANLTRERVRQVIARASD